MKISLLFLLMIFALISCGKKDSDNDGESFVVDGRVYEGGGTWYYTYTDEGVTYNETATFASSSARFVGTASDPAENYDLAFTVKPTGTNSVLLTSTENLAIQMSFTYSIKPDGNLFICDKDLECSTYTKTP